MRGIVEVTKFLVVLGTDIILVGFVTVLVIIALIILGVVLETVKEIKNGSGLHHQ